MYSLVYNKGLSKEVLNAIKNREYTKEELVSISQELNLKKSNKNKGMRSAMIIFALCAIFVLGTAFMTVPNSRLLFLTLIGFAVIFIVTFIFLKINFVNKAKRQFINALQTAYPEFKYEFDNPD